MSFVSHVECTICGHRHDAKRVLSVCEQCGQMLAVRYDLEQVNKHVTKEALRARPPGMYLFRELTPLDEDETPVTLGEGSTPLLALRRLAAHFGLRHVWGKDEGQNPTGSFKARGLGMAITLARARGATGFVIPSAGNAGGAAAVYAARCGLPCAVIVPRGTPPAAIAEAAIAGAKVFTIEGSIATAGKVVAKVAPQIGWFDLSTLKEPYRLEGKKTMGLELAEQLGWTMPDILLYPTGGGTGLVGIPKGYEELRAMGWVGDPLPRVIAVQAEGCAPVVKAFHDRGVGEPDDARGGAARALALRRAADAEDPARHGRRCRRGERARHPGRAAAARPSRGRVDVARGRGARGRPRRAQGAPRHLCGRARGAGAHGRRHQVRPAAAAAGRRPRRLRR